MAKRVTIVLNCLKSGGAEKQLLWIAAEIVDLGYNCDVFELISGDRTNRIEYLVDIAERRGVKIVRAPVSGSLIFGFWRLRKYWTMANPTVVWSWGLRADCTTMIARLGKAPIRWLTSRRCSNVPFVGIAYLQSIVLRRSNYIVSNTHAAFATLGLGRKSRVERVWLPNVVKRATERAVELPATPPGTFILVMLGNIKMKHKGYDIALFLADELRRKGYRFELRIAGRPDEIDRFNSIRQKLKVESLVRYYGEISNPEAFLSQGHIFLLLSRYEGMPNTLLEAMSVGLPAIATDVGDLRRLKEDGAPFVLIPTENVASAANELAGLMVRWRQTVIMAQEGRVWVEKTFSEQSVRRYLSEILSKIL